jgi:hypothetical protein
MRAEEIIAQVFKRKRELLLAGEKPEKIILSRENYETLEDYRRKLPPYPPGVPDYIGQYSLFDLPIFIDNSYDCDVV